MNLFRRFRDAAICVALLAIPFFVLNSNLKDPTTTNWLDRLILRASSPLQFVGAELADGVSSVVEDYVLLLDVRDENERLAAENARLRAELADLRSTDEENRRLRDLLAVRETLRKETLTARVIGKEPSTFFRVRRIRLDRGESERVQPGMPVLAADGLVGQIQRVVDRYSDVLLTVDASSAIDVVVRRTGARGMLRGTGESDRYLSRIELLERTSEVRVGDEVHTSGLGMRFPEGIHVGTVSRVVRLEHGMYQEVEVVPAVDFAELEEVLVLTAGSRERQSLEDQGADDDADAAPPDPDLRPTEGAAP